MIYTKETPELLTKIAEKWKSLSQDERLKFVKIDPDTFAPYIEIDGCNIPLSPVIENSVSI